MKRVQIEEKVSYWRSFYLENKSMFRKWIVLFLLHWYIFSLPDQPFNDSYSTVILSTEGELLGAHIAKDGQWRFPPGNSTPYKLRVCLTRFEDKHFRSHLGFSTKGICRALLLNLGSGKVKSGGSTITQQVVRLMRKNPPRTYFEKVSELLLATRLELHYSKDEILNMYSAHAPFGNNVVGIEAASWRYFGRSPDKLSWAESATLAVLPNAPGLIYPGKNHSQLLAKRNRLLKDLYDHGFIDQTLFASSLEEALPDKPLPLPQKAYHLLQRTLIHQPEKRIETTLKAELQEMSMNELSNHMVGLEELGIHNGSVLISSVETGEILAYVGNTTSEKENYSCDVDCIQAARSPGSILKPLLYLKAMEDGIITPNQLLPDIPSRFGNFSPNNFSRQYLGAVPANKALCKSLNIPMVYLLREYGLSKFHKDLKNLGFRKMNRHAQHYGLSLILGGGEASSWEINSCYNTLASSLITNGSTRKLFYDKALPAETTAVSANKGCIFSMLNAITEVSRPDEDNNWRAFESAENIAWKTGTSFGFRDAWAVGITPKYVVTIWIGNASGEGKAGLTGVKAAAPLLFSIFRRLNKSQHWFNADKKEMRLTDVCSESGCIPSRFCTTLKKQYIPKRTLSAKICPYHQLLHTSIDKQFRVNSSIVQSNEMLHISWFVLSPLMEKYYAASHPNYMPPPPFDERCKETNASRQLAFIYPKPNTKIHIPKEINGLQGKTIFEVSNQQKKSILYWHLDDKFIGSTTEIHQIAISAKKGKHQITVVDGKGTTIKESFEVVSE